MMKRRLLILISVGAAVLVTAVWMRSSTKTAVSRVAVPLADQEKEAAPPPTVLVAAVMTKQLSREIRLPGEFQAYQDVAVYPKVQGFVDEIEVDRGSPVQEGQMLARLIAPELAAQTSEAQAKAQAAQAQRLEAEAKLAAEEATYKRLKAAAAEPGVVSGNDLEIAQKVAEADHARVQAWRENEQAARDALRSFREIESYLRITAPFDGVITERNVHKGSLVGPSAAAASPPMLRIRQVSRLRLTVPVPEAEVAGIDPGAELHFTVPAFPGEVFGGAVARVAHALDAKTRTMPVELDVNNSGGRLAPGMYAEVMWPTRRSGLSLFVPLSAIVTTTERTFVIRIRDGVAEWVDVKRGAPMGDLSEVFGDLKAGDLIVRRGTDELRAGSRVVPKDTAPTN